MEVSHVMSMRSLSFMFFFFWMLQFSGKNFSARSLSQGVATESRWLKKKKKLAERRPQDWDVLLFTFSACAFLIPAES